MFGRIPWVVEKLEQKNKKLGSQQVESKAVHDHVRLPKRGGGVQSLLRSQRYVTIVYQAGNRYYVQYILSIEVMVTVILLRDLKACTRA